MIFGQEPKPHTFTLLTMANKLQTKRPRVEEDLPDGVGNTPMEIDESQKKPAARRVSEDSVAAEVSLSFFTTLFIHSFLFALFSISNFFISFNTMLQDVSPLSLVMESRPYQKLASLSCVRKKALVETYPYKAIILHSTGPLMQSVPRLNGTFTKCIDFDGAEALKFIVVSKKTIRRVEKMTGFIHSLANGGLGKDKFPSLHLPYNILPLLFEKYGTDLHQSFSRVVAFTITLRSCVDGWISNVHQLPRAREEFRKIADFFNLAFQEYQEVVKKHLNFEDEYCFSGILYLFESLKFNLAYYNIAFVVNPALLKEEEADE